MLPGDGAASRMWKPSGSSAVSVLRYRIFVKRNARSVAVYTLDTGRGVVWYPFQRKGVQPGKTPIIRSSHLIYSGECDKSSQPGPIEPHENNLCIVGIITPPNAPRPGGSRYACRGFLRTDKKGQVDGGSSETDSWGYPGQRRSAEPHGLRWMPKGSLGDNLTSSKLFVLLLSLCAMGAVGRLCVFWFCTTHHHFLRCAAGNGCNQKSNAPRFARTQSRGASALFDDLQFISAIAHVDRPSSTPLDLLRRVIPRASSHQ
ncbi:hypothetical protein DE146DRAFT_627267 [Phaeosphaeria sp. MPI-PUGE-AT-0046c]|nr:hypothetical protein DE146DRAFT_627267 [Phaeosphaeria sp. MPI-PUGE-AT-0046c]